MYRQHFGLTQHPFSNEIEPDELFLATSYKELEVRLTHLIDLRGIGFVTGDSGSGKTCCCRKVLHALHASLYRVLYVCLSTGNVMDLYKTISWEMGLPVERSRAALFRQIRAEVTRLVSEARCRPILVIDEAHHLRPEVLEELRLLTNYNMDAENRLCLLLLGQSELRRRLSMAVHEALSQRIVVRIPPQPPHSRGAPPTISPFVSVALEPNSTSSSRPHKKPCSRRAAACHAKSISSLTTLCSPPLSLAPRPSPPNTVELALSRGRLRGRGRYDPAQPTPASRRRLGGGATG